MSDPTPKKPRSGVYLPTLPKGYHWHVSIMSAAEVDPDVQVEIGLGGDTRTGERQVQFRTDGETVRGVDAADLNEAAKIAADGVRTLDRIRREKAALVQAEAEALMSLGEVLSPKG